ncbi:ThuA domain-containing protein [Niabella hirudinis]|uniref:ThuA domain-containing protein n=1 Tax=Niabella hirudinis TaxID=1285929 RepID=UPI003EC12ACA
MVSDFYTLDTTNDVRLKAHLNQRQEKNKTGFWARYVPSAWYHDFDGGVTWCTTLGHDKIDYSNPVFLEHLPGGIEYVAKAVKALDFSRAYAKEIDDPVKY